MRLALFICLLLVGQSIHAANSWYAATNGATGNTGSFASPWDLRTALIKTNSIIAGDTLWLLPGIYKTNIPLGYINGTDHGVVWKSLLKGTSSNPIWIRSYTNNNWARLDGGGDATYPYQANGRPIIQVGEPTITAYGTYNYFTELEFFSSSTESRTTGTDGSFPGDIYRVDGAYLYGEGSKLINCYMHDLTTGGSTWSQNIGGGFEGCLVWNNGWDAPSQRHGHGIYAQGYNAASGLVKWIKRNLFSFAGYDRSIQEYASSNSQISHFRTVENGFIGVHGSHGSFLLGTQIGGIADRLQDNALTNNFGWNCDWSIALNADGNSYSNVIDNNNYLYNAKLEAHSWKSMIHTNNYYFWPTANYDGVSIRTNSPGYIPWNWDRNRYHALSTSHQNFRTEGSGPIRFDQWQTNTGYDANSVITTTFPSTNYVIVHPNQWNTNFANAIIYNWAGSNTVAVDTSSLSWPVGSTCSLINSQDPLNDILPVTIVSGNWILADMRTNLHTVAVPYGDTAALGPTSFPGYGQFRIVLNSTGAGPPPPTTFVNTINSFNPSSGLVVTFSPNDISGLGNGTTSFSRTNTTNVVISLVAPGTTSSSFFTEWDRNGVFYSSNASIAFTNSVGASWTAVYTTTKRQLSMQSQNPAINVFLSLDVADTSGSSSGFSPFNRSYLHGTVVTATAPLAASNGNTFDHWNLNAVLYSTNLSATITNNADSTLAAVYVTPPPPSTAISSDSGSRRRGVRF